MLENKAAQLSNPSGVSWTGSCLNLTGRNMITPYQLSCLGGVTYCRKRTQAINPRKSGGKEAA